MTTRRGLLAVAIVATLLGGYIGVERWLEARRWAEVSRTLREEARNKRVQLPKTLRDAEQAAALGDPKRAKYLRDSAVLEAYEIGRLEDAATRPWEGIPTSSFEPPTIRPDGTMIFRFDLLDPNGLREAEAMVRKLREASPTGRGDGPAPAVGDGKAGPPRPAPPRPSS